MNTYLKWQEKNINDFSEKSINDLYNRGFLFGRTGKGEMYQTRSVRVDLDKFELSSENRRILRKTEDLKLKIEKIPYENYNWEIGKLGKDFYETKFGKGVFSANKIREILTNEEKSNFNFLLEYRIENLEVKKPVGYAICYKNEEILHYSYPFYELRTKNYELNNVGIGMMTRAVEYAKNSGKKYIYLGSAKDSKALYKFQFKGIEWFDKDSGWSEDIKKFKEIIKP